MAAENRINITSGPYLWDIALAHYDREGAKHRRATFSVEHPDFSEIDVNVMGSQAVAPMGDAWNLEGYGTVLPRNFSARERVRDGTLRSTPRRVFIFYRMRNGAHDPGFQSYLRFLD